MASGARTSLPLLVVDAANVVGSVPDGWWRDRAAATARLRDALGQKARVGLASRAAPPALRRGPLEIILVVEGAARSVAPISGVHVVMALGSGDDAIVDVVDDRGRGRPCFVATADRGLAERVRRLGAEVVGPRTVR